MNRKITVVITVMALALASVCTGCKMEVAPPVVVIPLVDPYISSQPASVYYYTDAIPNPIPPLTVETERWNDADGALSYQWYKFADITAYLKDNVTEIAGATTEEYKPVNLTTTAGGKNYFYVVVTNTNGGATDRTTASVRSAVAVISFLAPGAPPPPIITRQPLSAQARFGRAVNPLSVKVEVEPGDDITYRWYSVALAANGTLQETELEGETGAVYSPSPGDLKLGDNYFYVKVTRTEGGLSATETSIPANIEILKAYRAGAPFITEQPKPALYLGSAAVAITPLSVDAATPDFGTLSYQWYSNASGSNKNGTLIANATAKTYTPTLNANQSLYYYVVVTNTNPNVINEQTAALSSRAVNVRRATAANMVDNAVVTIRNPTDPNNRYNYIRGYGGMDVGWANFPETTPADTELMYDPDILGYNVLRIMIPLSNTNIDLGMADMVNNRRKYYYENVKIVNKYGGFVAAAPWSPPKEWKSNNSINGGGFLIHAYYDQYAKYLKSFAQHMYNHGAPIYCISIQNEPNYTAGYDGCEWEPGEMRDFFKRVGIFTEGVKGWGGGREIPRVLTMNGESANTTAINHAAIDDPDAYKNIDVFSRHIYGERNTNLWSSRPRVQRPWLQSGDPSHIASNAQPKEIWMMEHNINSANATAYPNDSTWNYVWRFMNDVDLTIRQNNENVFVWWASKRFYSMIGDGQFGTRDGAILPRGWGLSHYAKYTTGLTRIAFDINGATRDGADVGAAVNGTSTGVNLDNTTVRITAFASENGDEISLVMWTPTTVTNSGGYDMGIVKVEMPTGFEIGSATAIRSRSSSGNNIFHEPYDVPVAGDRRSAYVELPKGQIVSVKFTKR